MEVTLENTSNLGRKLTIKIDKEIISSAEQQQIKELSKSIKVDGFRKGHVPSNVVKQRYGKQVRQEAVAKLIEKNLFDAIEKENLNLADRPTIEKINDKSGEDLSFVVSLEIMPEIELKDYSELSVEKETAEITEKDVDEYLEKLQNQFSAWENKEGKAEKGDRVIIDFVGYIDDKPFENGAANDYPLELGSGTFIPGFEEGLIGVSKGEQVDVEATFPEEYTVKELAGKKSIFKVTVKSVESKKLAELDSEFAKKIGIEDGDASKIREKLKENLEKYLDNIVETKVRDKVLEKFLELHDIDVPESLLNKEIQVIKRELQSRQAVDYPMEEITSDAKKRVAIALLLNKVVAKHELKPDIERVRSKIHELSAMFGQSDFIEKMYHESEELMQNINHNVLCDQATDILVENATIKEKKVAFSDLVK